MNHDDVEASAVHDQLPSVEDAKIDADMTFSRKKSVAKQAVSIALSVVVVVLLLLFTVVGLSKKGPLDFVATVSPDPILEEAVQVLAEVSSHEDLITTGSPQNRAATWISKADHLGMFYFTDNQLDRFKQRYILTVFFYALGGENWEDDLGFLTVKDVCHWFGTHVGSSKVSPGSGAMRMETFGFFGFPRDT